MPARTTVASVCEAQKSGGAGFFSSGVQHQHETQFRPFRIGPRAGERSRDAILLAIRSRTRRSIPMVSTWWLLIAFVVGGSAGVIALALMQMAGDSPDV